MIRCVAVDVDGTLTDREGVIHHEVVAALERLKRRGTHVLLTSATCYPVLVGLAYYLPVTRLVVAENGGVVGFKRDYEILGDPSRAQRARRVIMETGLVVDSWQNRFRFVDLAFKPVQGVSIDYAAEELRRRVAGMGVTVDSSGLAVHVRDERVDKGVGLAAACRKLGIDLSETAAIGDSDVDLPLFERAGLSVALANATERLKEEASVVVSSGYWRGFLEALSLIEELT